MRRILLTLLVALAANTSFGQIGYAITFDSLVLSKSDTFYVNYSNPGNDVGFNVGSVHFDCQYDTAFGGLWNGGFAYSNMTDSVTSGYMNQYSVKSGKGYDSSNNYAVYTAGYGYTPMIRLPGVAAVKMFSGFYVNNSTYAYNAMRDGYFTAKKFGGPTGNDPDWFKITVKGYFNGQLKPDSVEYYLADFRDTNNANDYIQKDWWFLSTQSLGNVDSMFFELSSSDTAGGFGMNTPAYFCMDNLEVLISTDVHDATKSVAKVYPNPATETLFVEMNDDAVKNILVLDAQGKMLQDVVVKNDRTEISVATLPSGTYFLSWTNGSQKASVKFVKP